ncbi:MAG: tetratricopeptide repeat protein [Candidatus Omnitrophica bacterium]|nr:tetratricopeptide repeat protein [Candidatus Omnitrophota bacterium]
MSLKKLNVGKVGGGIVLCLLVMTAACRAWTRDDLSQFKKANQAFREGRYEDAAAIYTDLTEKYPDTATFYYNLGNSLYRMGVLGRALLNFERARFFEPRNGDIRYNLNYVRGFLEYQIEDKRNWYLKFAEIVLEQFTEKEAVFLLLSAYFIFMASWLVVLIFRHGAPWGWKRKTLFALFMIVVIVNVAKHIETRVIRDAVVLDKRVEVRYGPSVSDQVAFRLGEGLRVYVLDSREDWSRILLVNGESGWVKNSQIAKIHP